MITEHRQKTVFRELLPEYAITDEKRQLLKGDLHRMGGAI